MTKEEKEKIIELRNKGLSFLQIAKETGKGKSTVGRYLKEVGLNKNSNIEGCISGNSISFVGNIHVISKLQNYLKSTLGIRRNKIHERINKEKGYVSSYTFSFSSQIDVSKFYHYIYDNATIYLSRKKDKFVFN